MKQKIITGAILAFTLGPALYLGGYVFLAVVLLFLAVGSREISSLFEPTWPKWMIIITFLFIMSFYIAPLSYLILIIIALISSIFVFIVVFDWFKIEEAALWFLIVMIVGLSVHSISEIVVIGSLTILYVAIATYMTDTAAYFVGIRFGRHKLSVISPNKSIEGAIGGWVFGSLTALVYAIVLLESTFDLNLLLIASLIMPMVGQLGDLAFSAIKRHKQIKDFGTVFPEHGGVLDRIDSLLFNFLFFYSLLVIFS